MSINFAGIDKISDEEIQDVTSNAGLFRDELANFFAELDLPSSKIEHAKWLAATTDSRLQAVSVLQTWHKMKGSDATKQAVLSALEECAYRKAVEILQEKWNLKTEGTIKAEGMFLH